MEDGRSALESELELLDLASVDAVLGTTRSVRRKLDLSRPVEPEVLYDCINLSTQAPMGLGGESWRFLVVTDRARKEKIAHIYKGVIMSMIEDRGIPIKPTQHALIERLPDMPAMIFVCIIGEPPGAEVASQIGFYGSILPTAWSLMLALRSRNLGATWTSLLASRQDEIAKILEVPEGVVQTVMFPVAYTKGAKLKRAERQDARKLTYWNSWGNSEE